MVNHVLRLINIFKKGIDENIPSYNKARANLNKVKNVMRNTTIASKYIPKR